MKPSPSAAALLTCLATAAILWAAPSTFAPARADDAAKPASETKMPADGEKIVVLVLTSDTNVGPNMAEADTAARYYCTSRGKMPQFIAKERPPEFASQVVQQWSLMTYHCVSAGAQ